MPEQGRESRPVLVGGHPAQKHIHFTDFGRTGHRRLTEKPQNHA